MKSLCVKVPKSYGEMLRRQLAAIGLLNANLIIDKNEFLYLPITEPVDLGYELAERDFAIRSRAVSTYKELADVPAELRKLLPTSFDVVGQIALLKIPGALRDHSKSIGEALLQTHKNLRTVCAERGVAGTYRTRDIEVIAGINETVTLHTEYGMRFKLDIAKVYFSPRLATERWRVASSVSPDETIIDMFAGVGPFSLLIAKTEPSNRIFAIDINPIAIEYLQENIKLNRIDNVTAVCGDAREIVPKLQEPDRCIMNLPFSAFEFFECAFDVLRTNGIIHYYEIIDQDRIRYRVSELEAVAKASGSRIETNVRTIKTYSTTEILFGVDIRKIK